MPDSEELIYKSNNIAQKIIDNIYRVQAKNIILKKYHIRPTSIVFLVITGKKVISVLKLVPFKGYANSNKVAFRKWQELALPSIKIIQTGTIDSCDYILSEFISAPEGHDFTINSEVRNILAEDMGDVLSKMRKAKATGFGYIGTDGTGKSNFWGDYLQEEFGKAVSLLKTEKIITEAQIQMINNTIIELAKSSFQPTILHCDLYNHNVFVNKDDGHLIAISDPNPIIGDPLLDIAYYNFWNYRYKSMETYYGSKLLVDDLYELEKQFFMKGYEKGLGRKLSTKELNQIQQYELLIGCFKLYSYIVKNKNAYIDFVRSFIGHKFETIQDGSGSLIFSITKV